MFTDNTYYGYVIAGDVVPKDPKEPDGPKRVIWRVRVQTPGVYYSRRVTVDRDKVPESIGDKRRVRFNLKTIGRGKLIATDVEVQEAAIR